MRAMKPFFDTIWNFEGFEFVAFWLFLLIGLMAAGFFIDMLMQKQGFGPLLNAVYALLGVLVALYLRYNYLRGAPWPAYEPFLTTGLCFGTVAILLVVLAYIRNRVWK